MSGLAKIQAPPLAQNVTETAESKKTEDAKKVGQDFEAILVRQMLAQANLGGKGGYGDMATEALATAVTKGGGLGLGKIIEAQLAPHTGPKAAGATPSAAVAAFKKVAEEPKKPAAPASRAGVAGAPGPGGPPAGTIFSIPQK